jgi:hypothetical protein
MGEDMDTFEKAYRQFEFSELVRIALMAADWIGHRKRKRKALPASMPRDGLKPVQPPPGRVRNTGWSLSGWRRVP